MEKKMVSVLEAAGKLEVRRDTVHRLIKTGQFKAHRKTDAPQLPFMIDRASVEAYDHTRRAPAH